MINKTGKLKLRNTELSNRLRWEDDGGKMVETDYAMNDRYFFVRPVPTHAGMHEAPLQWSELFTIEPFQDSTRNSLIKRNAPDKT